MGGRFPSNPAYSTPEYKRKRLAALRQARWRCQIRIAGLCIGSASEADHTQGIANDPHHDHLRAACTPCHRHVTAQQGNEAKRQASGKTPRPDPQPQPRTRFDD